MEFQNSVLFSSVILGGVRGGLYKFSEAFFFKCKVSILIAILLGSCKDSMKPEPTKGT